MSMFIGLRPFTILMDGDTICVYTPANALVSVRNRSLQPLQVNRNFTRIATNKNEQTVYSPSLCCHMFEDGLPMWSVPSNNDECFGNIIYDVIGTVTWDPDLNKWIIDQHIIGRHTFNYVIKTSSSSVGENAKATISSTFTSILLDDGTEQPLTQQEIKSLREAGFSPGDTIYGEFVYEEENL